MHESRSGVEFGRDQTLEQLHGSRGLRAAGQLEETDPPGWGRRSEHEATQALFSQEHTAMEPREQEQWDQRRHGDETGSLSLA